jgi:TonB family protein
MSSTTQQGAARRPVVSDHLSVRPEDGHPPEVRFLFEQQEKRLGGALGASVVSHVAFVALALLIINLVPERVGEAILPDRNPQDIVWLATPGPGGGGGGGNKSPEPPKKAELPGPDKVTVPAVKPPEPTPAPVEETPPPLEPQMNIPAQTMAAGLEAVPGVIESNNASGSSTGSGTGTGAGAGTGSGLGEGTGGGTGGGVYRIGSGVDSPRLLRSVRPNYTSEAMRAKVQGVVRLEGVVLPDGTVGDVRVVRSLDNVFGLDDEAVKAAKQFRFAPGTRFGQPVAVLVTFEIEFTLR